MVLRCLRRDHPRGVVRANLIRAGQLTPVDLAETLESRSAPGVREASGQLQARALITAAAWLRLGGRVKPQRGRPDPRPGRSNAYDDRAVLALDHLGHGQGQQDAGPGSTLTRQAVFQQLLRPSYRPCCRWRTSRPSTQSVAGAQRETSASLARPSPSDCRAEARMDPRPAPQRRVRTSNAPAVPPTLAPPPHAGDRNPSRCESSNWPA